MESQQDRIEKALVTKLRNSKYHNTLYDDCGETQPIQGSFSIAVSFPALRQSFVRDVVEELEKLLPGEKIFYYPKFLHLLSGQPLDVNLRSFYRDQAELVVVFLCTEYAASEWCMREWWAIVELLDSERLKAPMLLRLDKAPILRLPDRIGFLDCQLSGAKEIAELIVDRLTRNRRESVV